MALFVATLAIAAHVAQKACNAYRSVTVTHFLLVIVAAACLHPSLAVGELQTKHHIESQQQIQLHPLDAHNFLVGIARIGAQREPSTQCGRELEALLEAIADGKLWGLKVLDSFGAAPRSFLWGNYFWFSSQDLCDDLNAPYSISFSAGHGPEHAFNVTSPFPLDFILIYSEFKSPHYIDLKLPFEYYLHLGLCLPRSCDAKAVFNYTSLYFREGTFETQQHFQLQLTPVELRRPHFSWDIFTRTGSVIFFCTCIFVFSLVITAEVVYKSRIRLQTQRERLQKPNTLPSETEMHCASKVNQSIAYYERILMCFRLPENYRRAIALEKRTKSSQNFLSAIAGLRAIICLWVTMFHVYYYSLYAMSNAPMIFAKLEHFALQPIMQACFYVDVFFVMSAFLLVYNFLQNGPQQRQIRQNDFKGNLKLYGKAVLHRYLRLTPVMIITMLLSDMVFDFLNMYSPFRLGVNSGIYCKRNWWYNLLYIHNLLDMRKICCSWTWYLACEMQYFLLFTALLYAYAKHPKVTRTTFAILAFGLVVISWLCNYQNGITFQIDVIHNTLNRLYVKPWVRINPYIGGAITGCLLHQLHQKQHKQLEHQQQQQQQQECINNISTPSSDVKSGRHRVERIWPTLFWFSCFALYAVTNFMSYWRSTPAWLVAAIMSFGKFLFALFIGGIIVLCALGRGGILQRLLSMRLLQFLNRFCFSIYMLAPVIVVAVSGLRREASTFTEVKLDFLGIILLSIASAFLLVLLVEMPMQRLSSILLRDSLGGDVNGCRRQESNGKMTNGAH